MTAIVESIEIDRRPEDVFAYLDQLDRHKEWQSDIVSAKVNTDPPTRVGTSVTETRRIGGREQAITWEITEHDPPRRFSFHGIDGPVRVRGTATIDAVGDGEKSRVTIDLDFTPHGLPGKLFAPMARSQARKQVPKDHQRLKERLEAGA